MKVSDLHLHAREMMGLQFDGENFFRVMGQFAPNPGEKVIVTLEAIEKNMRNMFRDSAKYGCD